MRGQKLANLGLAEKCKSILASNWQGYFNTIKADAKGSKSKVYTSKVKYITKRGKQYIWVPEKEPHKVNTMIDERSSFAVTSPFPGPIGALLKSIDKLPVRIALTGDVVPIENEEGAAKAVEEIIEAEMRMLSEFTYTVSGVISSANHTKTSRSESLKELLDGHEKYVIYKFTPSSCSYVDNFGGTHDIDMQLIKTTPADPLAPLSAKIVDGVNQSEARRRALILFCFVYLDEHARDAFMLSVDRNGFEVLAKVPKQATNDDGIEFEWKQFRFGLEKEAEDIESFCRQLVEMEEDAVKKVSSYSGLS